MYPIFLAKQEVKLTSKSFLKYLCQTSRIFVFNLIAMYTAVKSSLKADIKIQLRRMHHKE
jgi:hypothetical protein